MSEVLDEQRLTDAQLVAGAINRLTEAIEAATAPPAVDVERVEAAPPPPLATWAYVELMGHRVIVGYVEADELAGRGMLRIRRLKVAERDPGIGEPKPPLELEDDWRLYAPAAVYSFQPIAETAARERYLALAGIRESDDDIPF
jgi:hypothetical protein